jgi:hypothetical protein
MQGGAAFGHRTANPDRGQRILQGLARMHVHVHVSCRHQRQPGGFRHCPQALQFLKIVPDMVEFGRQPAAAGKPRPEPKTIGLCSREAERQQAALRGRIQVFPAERIGALPGPPPARGDQRGKRAIGLAIRRQQYEPGAVLQPDFTADNQLEIKTLRGNMSAHDAGQRAFIGNGKRGVAQRRCTLDEFLGMGSASQETEVGEAVKLCVVRQRSHAGTSLPAALPPAQERARGRSRQGNIAGCAR